MSAGFKANKYQAESAVYLVLLLIGGHRLYRGSGRERRWDSPPTRLPPLQFAFCQSTVFCVGHRCQISCAEALRRMISQLSGVYGQCRALFNNHRIVSVQRMRPQNSLLDGSTRPNHAKSRARVSEAS
jgi:hypothetical protein